MKTVSVLENLQYFNDHCEITSRSYATTQVFEGLRTRLAKGHEPRRSDLLWLISLNGWSPQMTDIYDRPRDFYGLEHIHKRWIEIFESDAVEEEKVRGVTRAEFAALVARVKKLEE